MLESSLTLILVSNCLVYTIILGANHLVGIAFLRLLCKAVLQNSELAVGKDKNDGSLWLLNDSVNNVDLNCREIFGFNLGSFVEIPAGYSKGLASISNLQS